MTLALLRFQLSFEVLHAALQQSLLSVSRIFSRLDLNNSLPNYKAKPPFLIRGCLRALHLHPSLFFVNRNRSIDLSIWHFVLDYLLSFVRGLIDSPSFSFPACCCSILAQILIRRVPSFFI